MQLKSMSYNIVIIVFMIIIRIFAPQKRDNDKTFKTFNFAIIVYAKT